MDRVRCFGPPIADLGADGSRLLKLLDWVSAQLAKLWPGMFGYQILIEATRPDSIETLVEKTFVDQRGGTEAEGRRV